MKRTIIIFLSMLFIASSIYAQKGKDDGGDNNEGEPTVNPDDNTNNNTDDAKCMNTALDITGLLFGAYQSKLINSSTNPTVSSFEILLHGGVGMVDNGMYGMALPRIRLNYGALSGDFRYNYLTFPGANDFFDAVLDFNIIVGKSFKMSIGQGIMYSIEETQNRIYHESYIGMDIGILDRSILISPEFRLAFDWSIPQAVNTELSLRGGYRILNKSSFAVYANLAAGYQLLNLETSNIQFYGGLDIFI